MKDTDSIDVGPLRPERAAQAGELLAASHADYPSFRHVFPDPTRRSRILRSFMGATARDAAAHGDALVAADTNGFVGVARTRRTSPTTSGSASG